MLSEEGGTQKSAFCGNESVRGAGKGTVWFFPEVGFSQRGGKEPEPDVNLLEKQ